MQGLQKVMRIVISLGFCEIMPSSIRIVLGDMVAKVNQGMCVCWNGCWGVGGVNESDMKDIEDNFLVSFGVLWFGGGLYVSVRQ